MQNPCPVNVPCVPCADGNPLAGNSSEAPDEAVFIGVSFQSPPLPLGTGFQSLNCVSTAISVQSQEEADLLATSAAQQCVIVTWVNPVNGSGGPPNPPVPPPTGTSGGEPYPIFFNAEQTGFAVCPDGSDFFWTTPAGLFSATSQSVADAKAQSYATQQAAILMTCLSGLPAQVCVDTAFNQMITATGLDANEGANNWEILSGMLPPSLSFSGGGTVGTFSGTVTVPGDYEFVIGVTGMDGGFVQKTYLVSVAGITNALPPATTGTAYSEALTTAGITDPVFALASGTLPDGLTLNDDGTVTGTPASDAVTSQFMVSMTDGVTGLVCTQNVIITVMAGSFWDLTWGSFTDLSLFGGSAELNSTSPNSCQITAFGGNTPPDTNKKGEGVITGTQTYTGGDVDCNLHVECDVTSDIATFEVQVFQDGVLIVDEVIGSGTADVPFTISAGVDSMLEVDVGVIVNSLSADRTAVATMTLS
jgi:hypothetical protein